MQYKGVTLCDYCFEAIRPGKFCPKCGLSKERYHAEAGLLLPGTILLEKYIIGRLLGRGGFGATYLAYSKEMERVVAIKEYFPTTIACRGEGEKIVSLVSNEKREIFEKGAKRFYEEAKTMARFNQNENVVSVYEFFYDNATVYYSMEYLEGIDLKGYIEQKGGRLSQGEVMTIWDGVCEALIAVHSTQTLHRDVSPDNIFICTNGNVKLIDFGAAKQVVGEQANQKYSVVVKQGFAPAEQYQTNGNQGVWTDIYAAGATMYYALTGEIPPDAINRLANPEIAFDPSLKIDTVLAEIINKCLELKIENRYQSALELMGALSEVDVAKEPIGGNDYVQKIYRGKTTSGLDGEGENFIKPRKKTGTVNKTNDGKEFVNWTSQTNTQYLNESSSTTKHTHTKEYSEKNKEKEKDRGLIKGILIGAVAAVVVIVIVLLVVLKPAGAASVGAEPSVVQYGNEGEVIACAEE